MTGEQLPSPDHIPIEEARYLGVQARTDELKQLEEYVDKWDENIDADHIRRHIIMRRVAIVAIGVRPADAEVPAPEPEKKLYGRTPTEWHEFLTGDNLDVPCSRYGRDASSVAWWAVAAIIMYDAYMGEPDDIEEFANHAMSLVVNDDDEIGASVGFNLHLIPAEVRANLSIDGEPV